MWKKCCFCFTNPDEAEADVQELDYHHASLQEVPPEIFTYERTLEKLDLGSNQIADLPPSLFHCHELRELNLCDNEVREIPAAVESLTRLAKLEISRNSLTEVPESIKNCKNLTYLDLSINTLSRLPEAICLLVNLEELFLNETNLEFLPANFGRLTKLRTLELRENALQTLPKSMNRLHQLQKLDIGSNDIDELPEVIGTMTNLLELWADNNMIRQIPKFIGNLTKLVCLDLSKNELSEISSDIGQCANLEDITLSCNSLTSLPDAFTKIESAATLRADNNCITALPEDLGKMKNLQEISVGCNLIKAIPPSVGLLRKLHTLYMDNNRLADLPKEVGSCTSLTVLSVAQNCLMEIPSEIGHLGSLKMLNLTNNSIRNLPVSILGLSNLGALWLTDGQNKPLVALNREIDSSTGQHVVTCCLLPQLPIAVADQANHDTIDEEPRRSQRKIRFQNEVEAPPPEKPILNGGLLRAPTPYPKELRAMAKHASQYRQTKGQNGGVLNNQQNEPMYEGDIPEEPKDPAEVRHRVRLRPYNYQLQPQGQFPNVRVNDMWKQDKMFAAYERIPTQPENLKHCVSLQDASMDSKQKFQASKSEGYLLSHHQGGGPQDANINNEPIPPIDQSSSLVAKTPPPYHIAAKRAAFLRSSGGAGSGKMNFPEAHANPVSDAVRSSSANSFTTHGQHDNMNNEGQHIQQESSNNIPIIDSYQESTVPQYNNGSYNLENMQLNDNINNPTTRFNEVLPDKNANIASSKPLFSTEDAMNANIIAAANSDPNADIDETGRQECGLSRDGKKQSSFKESRIPTAGKSFTPMKSAPCIPVTPKEVPPPPPQYDVGPSSPGLVGQPGKIPLRKFGSPLHYEPVKSMPKPYNSVSHIGSSEMSRIGGKPSLISPGQLKHKRVSDTMKSDVGNNVTDGGNASASKSQSRIPKFGPMKGEEAEVEKPPAIPQSLEAHDKSKIARSGIPKLSSGREIGDPKQSARKPWIFGSHRNARVESVEYRKIGQDRLGFTIDEFSGPNAAPDVKGIYVTGTDSNDLPIKVGDKILQVDGIDVDVNNMGVAIVSKILTNCQENIQFLVSRQN